MTRKLLAFFFALAMALSTAAATADNDKMTLAELYKKAMSQQYTEEGLRLSRLLYSNAVRLGDLKAQCMALNVQMNYYKNKGDGEKFNQSAEKIKATARRGKIDNYYYFAYNAQVLWFANNGQEEAAIKMASRMTEQAMKENSAYGVNMAYKAMGDIYFGMGNYDNAMANYKMGLEYMTTHMKSIDPTIYYAMLSVTARCDEKNELAVAYADEGLKHTKSKSNIASLKISKAYSLYLLKRNDEFKALMTDIGDVSNLVGTEQLDTYYLLKSKECCLNKDYGEAFRWAEKIKYKLNQLDEKMEISEAMGDTAEAYKYYKERAKLWDERRNEQHSKDLAEANARFENERLKAYGLNSKLQATQAENKRKQAEADKAKLEIYNKELNLHNSNLKASKLKTENILKQTELDRQKAEMELWQANHRTLLLFLGGGILILVIIVVSLIINRQSARRFIRKLTEKNRQLVIARDKAQQSDRMKTIFVQNISHEVRTPLNAIVGFSDLMLNSDMEITPEEQKEYKEIIRQNVELLTGLVNDMIMLSEFQSGELELNISDCHVNKLCVMAIDSVSNRKPDNVELKFTTDADDDFTLKTDSIRLEQILINFLTNAEKFTSEGSITLHCATKKEPGRVVFTVTDTGPGIPKEKQKQVFEGFEKLGQMRQGMGIGLKLSAYIASKLGADIGIDSNYTAGARFYLSLKA